MSIVDFAKVVNAADVFVRDLARHAHFTMKPRERGAVTQQMFGKELQRDRLTQFQVIGAIDFAHAAFANQAHDAITLCQHRARHEARVIDRIERCSGLLLGFARRTLWRELLGGIVKRETATGTRSSVGRNLLVTGRAIHRWADCIKTRSIA